MALAPLVDEMEEELQRRGWTTKDLAREVKIPLHSAREMMRASSNARISDFVVAYALLTGKWITFKLTPDVSTPRKAAAWAETSLKKGNPL